MGGCASKPKELEYRPDSAPAEAPAASPEKTEQPEAEAEIEADADVQQAKANGGEKQNYENEALLVDLSEPKEEEAEESSGTKDAKAETAENKTEETKVTAEVTEKKEVEAAVVGVVPKADQSIVPNRTSSETEKTDALLVTNENKMEESLRAYIDIMLHSISEQLTNHSTRLEAFRCWILEPLTPSPRHD